ncbi:Putative UDP-rhamnose:rhamnosyltransferase 1 [Glycine soja]|nr:Putative UDP-rhamnose:rhamnosyltransferase 1 [Glycine soja]
MQQADINMAEKENAIHVLMLPRSAFGHLMPFFQLSIALAKAGVHVSFISTPKKIQRLPKIPSTLSHSVHFVQLPLPSLDNELLAEGAEATVDIPFEKVQYLKAAYDQMQHSVKQFVANQSPDCIICDFSPHWIIDIALEFQVQGKHHQNGCYEIGGEYLNAFQKLVGKPVIPIGLLPVDRAQRERERERGIVDECSGKNKIFEWLDKQASKSVVFVGFGSECKLSKDQVSEIAYGLEESQLLLLWALRKPSWASNDQDSLPVGFIERTSNRGVVVWDGYHNKKYWHIHLLEGLCFTQGLAIEVRRNEDGSFTRNDIGTSLRQAMVLEEGKKIRINTREAAAIVGNLKLHQDHYIVAFVLFLKDGIWKQI